MAKIKDAFVSRVKNAFASTSKTRASFALRIRDAFTFVSGLKYTTIRDTFALRIKYTTRSELLYLALASVSIVGILVFFIIPYIVSIRLALIDNIVRQNFVGLRNFTATLDNTAFRLAMGNTARFMLMSVPLNMGFALFLAIMLKQIGGIGKNVLGAFFLLPLVIPSGSVVHFWRSLFGLNGFINGLFVGEPVDWFNTEMSLFLVVIIFLWKNVGFNTILYLAGLNLIPKEYYEGAAVDGAGPVSRFRSITLVYLMPTTFMVFLLSIIQSFQSFREIFLLTGAYPHRSLYMLQHYLNNLFTALDYQRLSAGAHILTLGIVALVLIMLYVQRRVLNYE